MRRKEKAKKRKLFRLHRAGWVFGVGAAVVIGGIMSFGLIGVLTYGLENGTAIYMLAMIYPMSIVIGISIHLILKHMEKYLLPLVDAIEDVAGGNLDVKLDVAHSGEYEKIYESFNLMTDELKETKLQMENFVNEFTHEFKTPITSIKGFADYLYEAGDECDSEEYMKYLKVISDQAERLSNMSQNVLLLSKIESCQIVTDKEEFSISEQIKECVILLLKQIEKKQINLDIDEDMDINYYGNQELLEQVWLNILGNAIKFTPVGGRIKVSAKVTGENNVTVTISDTGIGMSKETQEHIFDKYYQNDSNNITNGNGIGLAIVKRIVKLCGGSIYVESELKKGSTFIVEL